MKSPITSLLDHLWEFKTDSKRSTLSAWRRLMKAYNITPRRHLAVIHQGNGSFLVESESRAGQMHSIDIHSHGCSCEDKQIRKPVRCKHEQLIQRLIDEDIFAGDKTPNK